MVPTLPIPKLHLEHNLWIAELLFAKEEIGLFERYLENEFSESNPTEVNAQIEQFQNRFICHKEVIDYLKHDLNLAERQLVGYVKQVSGMGLDYIRMDNHVNLRDRMKTFRKIYNDLKNEFRRFEAQCIN
jgi:hypothetical protein